MPCHAMNETLRLSFDRMGKKFASEFGQTRRCMTAESQDMTPRWYSVLGFQFTRRQLIRASILFAIGAAVLWLAFAGWYYPPRWTSVQIRAVGGWVSYRPEQGIPNRYVDGLVNGPARMIGLTATDEEADSVQLQQAQVTDAWLDHLRPLEGLRRLDLDERQLGPGLKHLGELKELSNVGIWRICSADIGHLRSLSNLRAVRIVHPTCEVDLGQLAQIPHLTGLEFLGQSITRRQLEQISRLDGLVNVHLWTTRIEGDAVEGLSQWGRLSKLQQLFLYQVTDEMAVDLARIQSLEAMQIDDPKLTLRGVESLAKLKRLRYLILQRCSQEIDVDAFGKRLPQCEVRIRRL